MPNPWEEISLEDYEKHMRLASVMQLQAMNELMKGQFESYPVSSVMILGIAGGNGLEHIPAGRFDTVYGVDINASYLREVTRRYPNLAGVLECLYLDLTGRADQLPRAELIVANLLIEYIGYECFQNVVRHVDPKFVSCVIQINPEDGWVSDSPYLHVFDGLDRVHHQIEETALKKAMAGIGYHEVKTLERLLPNGKKLVQIDFGK